MYPTTYQLIEEVRRWLNMGNKKKVTKKAAKKSPKKGKKTTKKGGD